MKAYSIFIATWILLGAAIHSDLSWGQVSFIQSCGLAPVRLIADQIRLKPRKKTAIPKGQSLQFQGNCKSNLCRMLYSNREASPGLFQGYALDSQGLSYVHPGLEKFVTIEGGKLSPRKTYPIQISSEAGTDRMGETPASGSLLIWMHDLDLSLWDFAQTVSSDFEVIVVSSLCPLSLKYQGDFCSKFDSDLDLETYDPSEIDVHSRKFRQNLRQLRKETGIKGYHIGERLKTLHDMRGFAYAVQYVNQDDPLKKRPFHTRYTSNPYRIFRLLTETHCPKWKIKKASYNYHGGRYGHARYFKYSEKEQKIVEANTDVHINANLFHEKIESILNSYAPGSELRLMSCWSYEPLRMKSGIKDDVDSIGNFFASLPKERNPIAVIYGTPYVSTPLFPNAKAPVIQGLQKWTPNSELPEACGLQGSIPERIKNCDQKKRNWRLITRTQDMYEVWLDRKAGLVWGDSLEGDYTLKQASEICSTNRRENGNLPDLQFRLPSPWDFGRSHPRKMSHVLPNLYEYFWTSEQAMIIDSNSHELLNYDESEDLRVRCVADYQTRGADPQP